MAERREDSAAMRLFLALAGTYALSRQDAARVLQATDIQFETWRQAVVGGGILAEPLPVVTQQALRDVVFARTALRSLFVLPYHALAWMSSSNAAEPFAGQSPIDLLRNEAHTGARRIADYLRGVLTHG